MGEPLRLDALAADPTRARELPHGEAVTLLAQAGGIVEVLRARVAAVSPGMNGDDGASDDMLTAEQAAPRTGMSKRWLYANARTLPFARRVSARAVRFSAGGIKKWNAAQEARQRARAI